MDVNGNIVTASLAALLPRDPTPDTTLVHLKLLHALQEMKEDVGYTDGLWGIWDSRADNLAEELSPSAAPDADWPKLTDEEKRRMAISRIREKRWAVFVARAVDRYESWWHGLSGPMLSEADMESSGDPRYGGFTAGEDVAGWEAHMLPPLGSSSQMGSTSLEATDGN